MPYDDQVLNYSLRITAVLVPLVVMTSCAWFDSSQVPCYRMGHCWVAERCVIEDTAPGFCQPEASPVIESAAWECLSDPVTFEGQVELAATVSDANGVDDVTSLDVRAFIRTSDDETETIGNFSLEDYGEGVWYALYSDGGTNYCASNVNMRFTATDTSNRFDSSTLTYSGTGR